MSRQNHLLHFHISKKNQLDTFDKFVILAAFIYPLSGIPQVIAVMNGAVDGVSLLSWVCFTAFSILFLVYGSVHKIKPMIITNFLWLLVDVLVVAGIIFAKYVN